MGGGTVKKMAVVLRIIVLPGLLLLEDLEIAARVSYWQPHSRFYPVAGGFIKQRMHGLTGALRGIGTMGLRQSDTTTDSSPMLRDTFRVSGPPDRGGTATGTSKPITWRVSCWPGCRVNDG